MPKTPVLTSKELIRMLLSNGFVLDRVKGSHHIYLQPELKRRMVVPMHKSDLPRGTLLSILKQAGIDKGNL
jgi:predicted RNA binding protein YcfA (HicA-like mRNA interferase family)